MTLPTMPFDIVYIVLLHGSAVELVEVLPRGTHVDIEDSTRLHQDTLSRISIACFAVYIQQILEQ